MASHFFGPDDDSIVHMDLYEDNGKKETYLNVVPRDVGPVTMDARCWIGLLYYASRAVLYCC